MLKQKRHYDTELSLQQKQELRQAFDLFDANGTGKIQIKEIRVAMRALGFEPRREEMKRFQQEFDSQNTGFIDLNDFIRIMTIKMTEKDTKEQIVKSFELFDTDNTGKISFKDIRRIASILG